MVKRKRSVSLKRSTYEDIPKGFILKKNKEITPENIKDNCGYNFYSLIDKENDKIASELVYDVYLARGDRKFSSQKLYVSRLDTYEEYRNRGLATFLLMEVIRDANKCGIRRVELEDASNNWGKKRNVYRNVGLYYKYNDDSTMVGNTRAIVKKRRKF